MILHLLQAGLLLSITVVIHAALLVALWKWLQDRSDRVTQKFWSMTGLLVQAAAVMVFAHLLEICVWAAFYVWRGALPDVETALYFSAVTYATIGYGDVVPPAEWRLVAGVEGLTGILMCGWSGGFFFALASRMFAARRPQG